MEEKQKRKNHPGLFKKGKSGNPVGRPGLPKDIKLGRKALFQHFHQVGQEMAYKTKEEIEDIVMGSKGTGLEKVIASLYYQAIKGSVPHATLLLDRLIGKPDKESEVEKLIDDGKEMRDVSELCDKRKVLLGIVEKLSSLPEAQQDTLVSEVK